ncbi:hypothetical protein BG015_007655 [Linnemannia schmuckeri]|uniref:F-box domain-containing protein n=1 Tax=Linnemannia schmuckeri TaxID=64567 RepID=A0A9P5VB51_9FUNG|nr:hypothetical protein BG015_007655 [Linnemannia schmuckeri]
MSVKVYHAYAYLVGILQDTNNISTENTVASLHRPAQPGSRSRHCSSFGSIIQLRSVLQLSPRLAELYLHRIRIEQESWAYHLARTISGITTLQTLRLTILSAKNISGIIAPTIFFACPPLIKTLSVEVHSLRLETYRAMTSTSQEEPRTRREEPLYRPTDFTMAVEHHFHFSDIVEMLEHSPELASMNAPLLAPIGSMEHAAATILNLCPKLRNLSLQVYYDDLSEQVAFVMLNLMPKDTLQFFSYVIYRERNSNSLVAPLGRHFDSLRSIKLIKCGWIRPEQVQAVLYNCSVLEVFVITGACDHELYISVGDLVVERWASTRFVELTLTADIETIENPRYQTRRDLTEEEKRQVLPFEKLYRQLGSLTTLRVLCLSVLVSADVLDMEKNPLAFRDYTFPGLLVLGDDDRDHEGQWGFLQELAGLGNLEVVRGSFNTEAWMPSGYEFEKRDAEFIAAHWPRLRSIEFVLPSHFVDIEGYNLAPHPYIVWLRRQLPQVKIVVVHDSTTNELVDEINGFDFD